MASPAHATLLGKGGEKAALKRNSVSGTYG